MMEKRKSRNKEDVRKLVLSAAMELFVDKGVENTSMRNIADKIGYSPSNVYLYFKNKGEILFTLHSAGFQKLRSQFQVLTVLEDPMLMIKTLGKVYLKFAAENPGLYGLMFNSDAPMLHLDEDDAELWKEGNNTFDLLKNIVQKCMDAGHFSGYELESLSFVLWSTVHGMASLSNTRRINRVKFSNPELIMEASYREFEKMIDRLFY